MAIVTLKAISWSDKRRALELRTTTRSVRRNIDEAKARLFESTEIEASREALVAWFWCHVTCCMAGALKAVESGTLSNIA